MRAAKSISVRIILIICMNAVSLCLFGQSHVIFDHLTIDNGLSDGTVHSIIRDSKGFMWFCADDGLNRYDGYNFKVYKPELGDKNFGLSIQFYDIAEDSFGRLWIGTSSGLYFLDNNHDRIVNFTRLTGVGLNNMCLNERSTCLFWDSSGFLWVGSYFGTAKIRIGSGSVFDIKEDDITTFSISSTEPFRIENNAVFSICNDRKGNIWLATNSDYLECFNYEENKISHYRINVPTINNWGDLSKKIAIDKEDNFWISTKGLGIFYWNRNKNIFSEVNLYSENNKPIDTKFVKTFLIDRNNRLLIGTDGNGLVVFDREKNSVVHYFKDKNDQSNMSSNAVYSIYEDPTGIFWIGNYITGISRIISKKLDFGVNFSLPHSETGLSHNIVTAFCEDQNGKIWISTDGGGLNLFDRETNLFKHYKHDPNDPSSISTNVTMALFCDNQNSIWVGTYNGGLNKFDQKTQRFKNYRFNPNDSTTISSNHPWSFAQDKNNNLWVATCNVGLNLLKPGTSSFVRYTVKDPIYSGPQQIISNAITHLLIDKQNRLWIATENGFDMVDLNKVDFNVPVPQLVFNHYLHSDSVNSISDNKISYVTLDNDDNIWIGTKGSGLDKLDLKTSTFTNYSVKDGLSHNVVNGILFDSHNNPWISTNYGISNLDLKTNKFINYSTSDGLQSNIFVKTSCLKTHDGLFFFGNINGFNVFYPEKIVSDKHETTSVLITDFRLFNQSIKAGDSINGRVILEKPIFEMAEIKLDYKENDLSFEFSAMNYSSPEKISFSYMMEGFNRDWQVTDAKMRIAKYTNLDPGEYVFKVRSSFNKAIWSDEIASIKIIIRPPWWKMLWFKIAVTILLVGFWIIGYSVRVYTLEKQKYILGKMVDEKTKQLQETNEKLNESNITKDKFLSIIAHDLINPFNTILGFSDLLLNNYSEYDDETRIKTVKTINDSSTELYELLGNLLQWSRSERGLLQYSPEKMDLNSIISKIADLFSATANAKNIKIELNLSDKESIVNSDVFLLNTILRNLISNSIKFTPKGGRISIKTEVKGKYIVVSVADNGVGISAENLENLFRIDIQHSTLGTNSEKGTGLGLFLVKEFVMKQKGELRIESEEGKGSTFSFTVPRWNV